MCCGRRRLQGRSSPNLRVVGRAQRVEDRLPLGAEEAGALQSPGVTWRPRSTRARPRASLASSEVRRPWITPDRAPGMGGSSPGQTWWRGPGCGGGSLRGANLDLVLAAGGGKQGKGEEEDDGGPCRASVVVSVGHNSSPFVGPTEATLWTGPSAAIRDDPDPGPAPRPGGLNSRAELPASIPPPGSQPVGSAGVETAWTALRPPWWPTPWALSHRLPGGAPGAGHRPPPGR